MKRERQQRILTSLGFVAVGFGTVALLATLVLSSRARTDKNLTEIAEVDQPEASKEVPAAVKEEAVASRAKARVEVLKKQITRDSKSENSQWKNPADQAVDRLVAIRACEKQSSSIGDPVAVKKLANCPFDSAIAKDSPEGYADLLVDQTVAELAFLKELVTTARDEGLRDPFSVGRIAKVYVQHSDDNVREQALALAELMPDSEGRDALQIAVYAMNATVSGRLAKQALGILARHRASEPELVDATLTQVLSRGGWETRDAVASQLLPFITPANRQAFSRIQAAEPLRSRVALHLRLNLEEFDRLERL